MFSELKTALRGTEKGDALISIINKMIDNCGSYVAKVISMEIILEDRSAMESAQFRATYAGIDRERRNIHDSIIDDVRILSRNTASMGLPFPFTGDTDDRTAIADFAKKVCDYYFEQGTRIRG